MTPREILVLVTQFTATLLLGAIVCFVIAANQSDSWLLWISSKATMDLPWVVCGELGLLQAIDLIYETKERKKKKRWNGE